MIVDRQSDTKVHIRSYIVADVRETNLAGQLFFQAMGFHAESVLRQFYSDTKEDAYKMVYDYDLSP